MVFDPISTMQQHLQHAEGMLVCISHEGLLLCRCPIPLASLQPDSEEYRIAVGTVPYQQQFLSKKLGSGWIKIACVGNFAAVMLMPRLISFVSLLLLACGLSYAPWTQVGLFLGVMTLMHLSCTMFKRSLSCPFWINNNSVCFVWPSHMEAAVSCSLRKNVPFTCFVMHVHYALFVD